MAGFNYSALVSPGGLSEQLGHLAGVIASANATNRATDVAGRRADIDQAFREAQLQHYKNMEERQGLSGAMNPLQQAHIDEANAHADYFRHLTSKEAAVKPPAMLPTGQTQLPMPDVLPSNPAMSAQGTDTDQAPSSMIRHVQDTLVMPAVRDKLKNGGNPHEAQGLMKSLMDQSMAGMGYPYNDQLQTYTKGQIMAPAVPGADPTAPDGASYVHQATPRWAGVSGQPSPLPAGPRGAQGGGGPGLPAMGGPAPLPVAPDPMVHGGLGAAMNGLPGAHHFGYNEMAAMARPAPAPMAPPMAAPAPVATGKVMPASRLAAIAAKLHGGDMAATLAGLQANGYTIDQTR